MKLLNNWVQCLNCGNEYSVSEALYVHDEINCPTCNSKEYTQELQEHNYLQGHLVKLNESLLEDGEWN